MRISHWFLRYCCHVVESTLRSVIQGTSDHPLSAFARADLPYYDRALLALLVLCRLLLFALVWRFSSLRCDRGSEMRTYALRRAPPRISRDRLQTLSMDLFDR